MMTSQQIELVRSSFALVQPIASQAAEIFYAQLFKRDPALRSLFRGDMQKQGALLMTMIGAAVNLLSRPTQLDAALVNLGARHGGYGVQPQHYDTVGAALLDTLALGLGEHFTAEVREAWTTMYGHISRTMQSAMPSPMPTPEMPVAA